MIGNLAVPVVLFSCDTNKMCGDTTAKSTDKIHSKRYKGALQERDSLCNLVKDQKAQMVTLNKSYEDLNNKYEDLTAKYEGLQQSTGTELSKLTSDLGNKQATLRQKEARLGELENTLRVDDSILYALNNSVKNALLGFNADELSVEMKNGKVYVSMSDKLLFKSGNADVELKGKEALKKLAEVLNKNSDISIAIEGHTDNVPIKTAVYKDNWDLSAARATNVVRLLTDEYKMEPRRLTAAGRGEFFPVADNGTTEGKAKNRRTDIVLSPKLDELMKIISSK